MATQVQTRRGTTTEHSTFTGAAGELTVDTTKKTVVVHDGSTAGGAPLLRENGSQNAVTTGTSTAASFIPTGSSVPTNGVYLPAANSVAISTNGTGRLFVNASGNVGIGASSPNYRLDASFGAGNLMKAGFDVNASGNPTLYLNRWLGVSTNYKSAAVTCLFDGSITFSNAIAEDTPLASQSYNERLRITSDGKLGLGNSSPSYKLDVATLIYAGNQSGGVRFGSSDSNSTRILQKVTAGGIPYSEIAGNKDSNGWLAFTTGVSDTERLRITSTGTVNIVGAGTAGSTQAVSFNGSAPVNSLVIDSTGKVGIGTSTPGVALTVLGTGTAGTIRAQTPNAPSQSAKIEASRGGTGASNTSIGLEALSDSGGTFSARLYYTSGSDTAYSLIDGSALATRIYSAGSERIRIDSTGRVGVGTTSPAAELHVAGSDPSIYLQPTADTQTSEIAFRNAAGSQTRGFISYSHTDEALLFRANLGERARITSSGQLLVGTASSVGSGCQLQIAATSAASLVELSRNNNDAFGGRLILSKGRGGTTIVNNNDNLGYIYFRGSDGVDLASTAASIEAYVDGTPGADDMPGRLVFSTCPSGSASPTERMRITQAGAVLVGTTNTPAGASSGALVAQSRVVLNASNAGTSQIIAGSPATNISATTGTYVFKFKSYSLGVARTGYVELTVNCREAGNTPSNSATAKYAFQIHQTTGNVCTINGLTTMFEYTFVRATHFAFADLGGGEFTITLTNPTGAALTPTHKVDIVTQNGTFTLDSVTTT